MDPERAAQPTKPAPADTSSCARLPNPHGETCLTLGSGQDRACPSCLSEGWGLDEATVHHDRIVAVLAAHRMGEYDRDPDSHTCAVPCDFRWLPSETVAGENLMFSRRRQHEEHLADLLATPDGEGVPQNRQETTYLTGEIRGLRVEAAHWKTRAEQTARALDQARAALDDALKRNTQLVKSVEQWADDSLGHVPPALQDEIRVAEVQAQP